MNRIYEELYEEVANLQIIDTHEHLPAFEHLRETETDFLREYLTQYFVRDLISAGLSESACATVVDSSQPLIERWNIVEPYWNAAKSTGYGRAIAIAVRELYGIDEISANTVEAINEKFQKTLEPGWYRKVLKEKSNIRVSLLHDIPMVADQIQITSNLSCDREFFRSVYPIDKLVYIQSFDDVVQIGLEAGLTICNFEDWLEACEVVLDNAIQHGAVALKSALAYQRSLDYGKVTRADAEEEFNEIFSYQHMGNYLPSKFTVGKQCQDYLMHHVCRLAGKRNLTFQFHTGLQEGNGNLLSNSDPSLLAPLFLQYPDVDFDLFHIGYPYQHIVGVLAKTFPNVSIDMCWSHIVSPNASVNALIEWLDTVPVNKISAFGGDYMFIDGVVGHQRMALQNVCKALTAKVEEGVFNIERGLEIAEMFLHSNPITIFKLEDKL